MGVDLGGLLPSQPVTLAQLAGKVLAVDAYNTLYQFLAIIRGPDGTPLRDSKGRVTSHLTGLLHRTANIAAAGVGTVFVFDGAPHPLKAKVLQARKDVRQKAQEAYEEAIAEGDLERARSKAQQTSTLSKEMVDQAKRLLASFGFPIVQAPSEGEAQASVMARKGQVYAAASQDFDSLLYGAPHLVRNLNITGRRKLPGRQAFVDVTPETIDLDSGLRASGLTQEQLIDIAILVGTDYNPGVAGIGPKTAVKIIKDYTTIEGALAHAGKIKGAGGTRLTEGREGLGEVDTIRRLLLQPSVSADVKLTWGGLDRDAVLKQLVDDHEFARERVVAALDKLASSPLYRRQKSISDWV
ncbi:MAG TPA: flap endonuclease-1 [Candidatus Thermoplasmatota archaeon]|nr:flap endonuclease-1 [Candidatus Thermoplasmatota archaeon]